MGEMCDREDYFGQECCGFSASLPGLLTEGFVLLSLKRTARGNVLPLAERGGRCEKRLTCGKTGHRFYNTSN